MSPVTPLVNGTLYAVLSPLEVTVTVVAVDAVPTKLVAVQTPVIFTLPPELMLNLNRVSIQMSQHCYP